MNFTTFFQAYFETRNCVRLEHLFTRDYNTHKLIGDFEDKFEETMDQFVEVLLGIVNVNPPDLSNVPMISRPTSVGLEHIYGDLDYLGSEMKVISDNLNDRGLSSVYEVFLAECHRFKYLAKKLAVRR